MDAGIVESRSERIPLHSPRWLDDGVNDGLVEASGECEPQLFANALHLAVVGENVGVDPAQPLGAGHFQHAAKQLGAEPSALVLVVDQDGKLRLSVDPAEPAQATDAEDLRLRGPGR